MSSVLSWLSASGWEPFILVTLVIMLERVLPWQDKYHPLTLFRLIALNLAAKVNPNQPRSSMQRQLSGSLAIIVLLLPMIIIVAISLFIAQYPIFFDGLMLLIALRFQPILMHFKLVKKSIRAEKKQLARHHLSYLVLRETETLSPMGMAKAAIEALVLRFNYQQVGIVFWYLIGGGLTALSVRLIYELSQCWNIKLRRYQDFGLAAARISKILFYLPSGIFAVVFSLLNGITSVFKAFKQRPNNLPFQHMLKLVLAGSLGIQLGGPAIYKGNKVRYPKVGADRQVRFGDMDRTLHAVNFAVITLLTLIGLTFALVISLTYT
ncbi:cobalamin biosynthesis protein [Aliiglaciecola sp. LCG003]|uniref:cobalamin biosynthesis protein CobD/CbiB n=1 Tax=Aliiglaciecola sp. LCG003 TaxID=3053655 RepID=UPI0025740C53|nr:cobalamin biosynthesis protein [Aliiglaciecola sp. LCG003]WJG08888.1 cobalamin biosynthesis protein [Aliiglaciecola sp. LCG003]